METDTPVRETERILTDEEAAERAARKEAAREARRKKKQRKKRIKTALLIVLAVILVIVAAFAGFLLYLQKCGTEYDNITECVQSQPMDFTQRYAFSSADKTMSVRLDKNDLWWLLYQTGAIEKLEKMDTALADRTFASRAWEYPPTTMPLPQMLSLPASAASAFPYLPTVAYP